MARSLRDIKRTQLEKHFDALTQEYEVKSNRVNSALDPGDVERLKRQLKDLERELADVERELDQLDTASTPAARPSNLSGPTDPSQPASAMLPTEEELSAQLDTLAEELHELYTTRDNLPPSESGLFEQTRIEPKEMQYGIVAQKLEDRQINRIYKAMLNLDHEAYCGSFTQHIEAQRVGAFLIRGTQRYGHLWLLKRLLLKIPPKPEIVQIPIDFSSRSQPRKASTLWDNVACRLKMSPQDTLQNRIMDRLKRQLQTKTVILTILAVEQTSEAVLEQIITAFWQPLVQTVQHNLPTVPRTMLLMFLIDFEDKVSTWNVPLALPADILFERLVEFSARELSRWTNSMRHLFVQRPLRVDETVQEILQRSGNGIPEDVAEQICIRCRINYQGEEKWLDL